MTVISSVCNKSLCNYIQNEQHRTFPTKLTVNMRLLGDGRPFNS